jgi:hypothetical protein
MTLSIFSCFLAICMSSFEKCLLRSFVFFFFSVLTIKPGSLSMLSKYPPLSYAPNPAGWPSTRDPAASASQVAGVTGACLLSNIWSHFLPFCRLSFHSFCWLFPSPCSSFLVWSGLICLFLLLSPIFLRSYPKNHCSNQWHGVSPYFFFQ